MEGRKEGSSQLPACRQKVRSGRFRAAAAEAVAGWRWIEGKDKQSRDRTAGGRKKNGMGTGACQRELGVGDQNKGDSMGVKKEKGKGCKAGSAGV